MNCITLVNAHTRHKLDQPDTKHVKASQEQKAKGTKGQVGSLVSTDNTRKSLIRPWPLVPGMF